MSAGNHVNITLQNLCYLFLRSTDVGRGHLGKLFLFFAVAVRGAEVSDGFVLAPFLSLSCTFKI